MPITGPDITQCSGFLVDDGQSAGPYSANLNETITICAPLPETVINLYFTVFNLGAGDYITIYNGPTTGAAVMGTYFATDLQSQNITSTNPQGCLTVQFVSDATGNGDFAAEISCGLPCIRPVSAITTTDNQVPLLVCPGEPITFNGAGSQFAPGTSMQNVQWIFDDGTTNNSAWPTVTHTYNQPGGYRVQLLLTDNTGCSNNNLTDFVVYVSTHPNFSLLTSDLTVCNGAGVTLGANFNASPTFEADSLNSWVSIPWTDLPDVDLGGSLAIPDDQSQCFENSITFTNFGFDAVITSPFDLAGFNVNMEHSFIGDLVISFICPNGQSIAVHQQGGGGVDLGVPVTGTNNVPGVGWDYSWSPTATNGTMAQSAGTVGFGGALPSGAYQSAQPWSQLIGCPLNGTWTVEICDMWFIDDGYIFDWSIEFAPQYYGNLLSFTPIYGADCDSSFWTGPFVAGSSPGCDFITLNIPQPGNYNYTYTLINDFGCSFDTTLTVVVEQLPALTAGPDIFFNCQPQSMQGGLINGPPTGYVYYWQPYQGLSNPASAVTPISSLTQTTQFTLFAHPEGHPECVQSDVMTVFLVDEFTVQVPPLHQGCEGDLITLQQAETIGGTTPFQYSWLLDNAFTYNSPSLDVIVDGAHEYCAIVVDLCGLRDTSCTIVTSYPAIPATFQVSEPFGCKPHTVLMTSDYTGFQNISQLTWSFGNGALANTLGSANYTYGTDGYYYPSLTIVDTYGCVFTDTLDTPIAVWPKPFATFSYSPGEVILPNTTVQFQNNSSNASNFDWTFDGYGTSEEEDPVFTFPAEQRGAYLVSLLTTNQYGCRDSTTRQVIIRDDIDIYIPNCFTPDYDGINDVWKLEGKGFQSLGFKLEIYNRWGERIYYSEDPYQAWTGNFVGGDTFVPDGVYLYRIRVRDIQNDVNHLYEGSITVIR